MSNTTTADGFKAPPELSAARRWGILLLLSVGVLISFVDRTNISSAMTVVPFKKLFHLSNIDRGWINSVFFWSYAVMQLPLGWVVDRWGVKLPYTICFVIWCAASALTGMATALSGLILCRLLIGAAEAIVVPASFRWIRSNFNESQNGTAIGIYLMGSKFGPALGAPFAAWLIVSTSWQMMFFISGIVGIIWLVPWTLLVRSDRPQGAALAAAKKIAASVPMSRILASPLVWGTLVINFCYNYFTFYCMTWMPAYLVEQRHLSLEKMGLYSFFSVAGIALVAVAAGWAADRLIARGGNAIIVRKAFIVAGFAIASTVVLGAKSSSLDWALFWNVASLSGLGLATANNLALCRLTLIPAPAVGVVTGLQQVATSLAGMVTPLVSGWLLQVSGGYDLPVQVIFVFMIIGALTTIFVLNPKWAPKVTSETAAS